MSPNVEQLFENFQRTGNPAAIAEVYDRIAPELLLLAAHVGHRKGDAEDLVQATFLAAIEQAQTYDSSRRLMPWIVGILVNLARAEHRRRRQPDPDRLAARSEVDPAHAAESAELAEQCQRILKSLPDHYRQTLTLRWVHGLAPVEIAHSLGISPATVKTRLRRGQEILRQALPAGFVPAALLAANPVRAATIRAVVVRRATELAARRAPTTGGIGATWSLRAVAAGILGCVATVTLIWWLWPTGDRLDEALSTGTTAPPVAGEADAAQPARGATPSAASRAAVSVPATPSRGAAHIEVRWSDGSPAPGVWVGLQRAHAADRLLTERWIRTDDDGSAEIQRLHPGPYEVAIDRSGRDACNIRGGASTVHRVTLPPGIEVRGTVRADGAAVAGAAVWLTHDGIADGGREVVHTDARGEFALRDVQPGRVLAVLAEGFAPTPLRAVSGAPRDRVHLDFDLSSQRNATTLSGTVIDEEGVPVANARVHIGRALTTTSRHIAAGAIATPPVVLHTDAAGRFRRRGLEPDPAGTLLWVRAPGLAPFHDVVRFRGDEARLEVRLSPAARLTGRIVDAVGEPLFFVQVAARAVDQAKVVGAPRWADSSCWTDGDGRYVLTGLPSAQIYAKALHRDGRRAATQLTLDGEARWDPILLPPLELTGRVSSSAGPIPGVRVEALPRGGRFVVPPVTTAPDGRFRFAQCEQLVHRLAVYDPAGSWSGALTIVHGITPPGDVEITVPDHRLRSSALRGRVVDPTGQPVAAQLSLDTLDRGSARATSDASSGEFELTALPPLEDGYLLRLETVDPPLALTYGPVQLEPGSTHECGTLVLKRTGRLSARVRGPDGRPVPEAPARIETGDGRILGTSLVRNGKLQSKPLAPGRYVLHFPATALAQSPRPFEIRAGETTRAEWQVGPGAVCDFVYDHPTYDAYVCIEITWYEADGTYRCRDRLWWNGVDPLAAQQRFAPGRYQVRVRSQAGLSAEAEFEVEGPDVAPPEVRLELR